MVSVSEIAFAKVIMVRLATWIWSLLAAAVAFTATRLTQIEHDQNVLPLISPPPRKLERLEDWVLKLPVKVSAPKELEKPAELLKDELRQMFWDFGQGRELDWWLRRIEVESAIAQRRFADN